MNYNNPYQNPYNQYPYSTYSNNNSNMQYQQYAQQPQITYQQQSQYQQPQQTNYLPLTFVNGIEGAKAFIVGANQTIYLKDSDSNILFEKKADNQGKYTLTAFELKQIEINDIGKETKTTEYITRSDLNALETIFESKIDKLSNRLEKLARNGFNKVSQKDSE